MKNEKKKNKGKHVDEKNCMKTLKREKSWNVQQMKRHFHQKHETIDETNIKDLLGNFLCVDPYIFHLSFLSRFGRFECCKLYYAFLFTSSSLFCFFFSFCFYAYFTNILFIFVVISSQHIISHIKCYFIYPPIHKIESMLRYFFHFCCIFFSFSSLNFLELFLFCILRSSYMCSFFFHFSRSYVINLFYSNVSLFHIIFFFFNKIVCG